MSDAFALGIQSSQNARRSQDEQAMTYAQIYSNMMLQTAQMQEQETRAKMQLQQAMAQINAGIQQEQIQQQGANARQQMTLQAGLQKSYLEKSLDIYKAEMDHRNEIEKTLFSEKMKGENELAKQRLVNEGNLATTILNNRATVTAATITADTGVFKTLLDQQYGPAEAKLIMDNYKNSLGATWGIFSKIGPSPKAQREEAELQLKQQQAQVLYAKPLMDPQTGKPIPGTGGLEWQKHLASQEEGYVRALGIFSENTKRSQELKDGLVQRMFATAEKKGGDVNTEAANMQRLQDLTKGLAANPSDENREIYKQQVAMIMASSSIPPSLWQNYAGIDAALSYNMMRSADVLGVGLSSMPSQEMINSFHAQQAPEVKSFVEKAGDWLWDIVLPRSVRSFGKKNAYLLGHFTGLKSFNIDQEVLDSSARLKQKIAPKQLAGMNYNEKLNILQRYAEVDPTVRETLQNYSFIHKSLPQIIGQELFGDFAESNPVMKEGSIGLGGDAAMMYMGGKILAPIAGGLWRTLAPAIRRAPIAGPLLEKIELATLRNSEAIASDWGPQFAKLHGTTTVRPGAPGIPFPKNLDPNGVYSQTFMEGGGRRLSEAGRVRLEMLRTKRAGITPGPKGMPPSYEGPFAESGFMPYEAPPLGSQSLLPGRSETTIQFIPGRGMQKGKFVGKATINPGPTSVLPPNPTLMPTPTGPETILPTFPGMPSGQLTQLQGGYRFTPGLEQIPGGYRMTPSEIVPRGTPVGIPPEYMPQQLNLQQVFDFMRGTP